MSDAANAHLDPLLEEIHQLGEHAREELEWGREHLTKDQFKDFHDRTVGALNKQVEHLLGFAYESDV
jgi:hypothetical protein